MIQHFDDLKNITNILENLKDTTLNNNDFMKDKSKNEVIRCFRHILVNLRKNKKPYMYRLLFENILKHNYFKVTLVGSILDKNEQPTSNQKLKYIKIYKYNKLIFKQNMIYEFIDMCLYENKKLKNRIYGITE